MNNKYDLSIIVPCYNELAILKDSVSEIIRVMDQTKYLYEIIFVDDKSSDGTQEIIKEIASGRGNMRWIFHEKNYGRGQAVVDGFKIANGEIVGFLDIDLEVHAKYIPSMIMAIKDDNFDMATAYRIYLPTSTGILRHILSHCYRWLLRLVLKTPLKDTEAGFKFFNKEKVLPLLEKTRNKGWFWDTEISYFAYRDNLRTKELPCLFIRRKDKNSTVRIFRDSITYLRDLWSFKKRIGSDTYLKDRCRGK